MLLNVLDYPTPAAALTAAQSGDRVYFPSGTVYTAPAGGWAINKSLEIFGDGAGEPSTNAGTTMKLNSANDHLFVVSPPITNLYFHDFKIKLDTQPGSDGTGDGIHCTTTTGAGKIINLSFERVSVFNLGNTAFFISAANADADAIISASFKDCIATTCRGSGLWLKNAVASYVLGGSHGGNRKFGAYCEATDGIRFLNVAFQNNQAAGTNVDFDAQLRLKSSHHPTVLGCHFEDFDNNTSAMTAICVENCQSGLIGTTIFYNPAPGVAGSRGIFINTASRGITVGPNMWSLVATLVEIKAANNNTGCIVLPQAATSVDANAPGTISLPDADSNGNFAFVPTTKSSNIGAGLLLPRVPTTVRDAIPAGILQRGIVIYNATSNKLNFYDGTAWRAVTSV